MVGVFEAARKRQSYDDRNSFSKRRPHVVKASDDSRHLRKGEKGATVVEYVLMLALIVILCIAGIQTIGDINALFFNVGNTL